MIRVECLSGSEEEASGGQSQRKNMSTPNPFLPLIYVRRA